MHEVRPSVPVHKWLFGFAIGLTVFAVPHSVVVYVQHLPGAILMLHLITTVGLWIFAELRRQWWLRREVQGDLTELVAAVERR